MDQDSLVKRLADLPLGGIRFFQTLGSTNDEAINWALAGAADMALVVADEQTSGRGRLGRQWFTPPASALAFSLVLRGLQKKGRQINKMPQSQRTVPRLTALGALAVCQTLSLDYRLPAQIKWPNDVVLERRKIAGILVEAQWQGEGLVAAILGIGINIARSSVPPPDQIRFPATCVEAITGHPIDRLEFLHSTLAYILHYRERLDKSDFVRIWEEHLAFRDEWVQIFPATETDVILEGKILGLGSDGGLKVQDRQGKIWVYHSGEIQLHPTNLEKDFSPPD